MKRLCLSIVSLLLFCCPLFAAIPATTVWEVRTTGAATNGAGYDSTYGGTDYSLQDAAQLNLTDLAMTTGGTTLTSATGGFTAAMVGNVIKITAGTNFTVGYYMITEYTDTNTVTLDRDATDGSNGSSGTGYVGGAASQPWDIDDLGIAAGNTIYVESGTYTLTGNTDLNTNGTTVLPITWEGYTSSRGDGGRATIAAAEYIFRFLGEYSKIKNFDISTTSNYAPYVSNYGYVENVKAVNTSGTANRSAFYLLSTCTMQKCEASSTNGYAVYIGATNNVRGSYIHDSAIGLNVNGNGFHASFNVIDTCTTGISLAHYTNGFYEFNTLYSGTTGVLGTTGGLNKFFNNIIDSYTTGASWTTATVSNVWDYNNWNNNTTDVVNVTKGANATALAPGFVDAANADFRIGTNLKGSGNPGAFPGAHASCIGYPDIGAVQRQEPASTGATAYAFG